MPSQPERLLTLDILRGFALVGILFVNFEFLAYPAAVAPDYSRTAFPGVADRAAAWLVQCSCDGKFILIFSFLFGYGLHLQMSRDAVAGDSPLSRYRRRLSGLLLIGLLHAVFLFVGDILVTYALLGFPLLLFRNARPRTLLLTAVACWAMSIVGHAVLGWAATLQPDAPVDVNTVLEIYRTGSLVEIVAQRLRELVGLYLITPLLFMPQVFGMFLLGLAAAKRGLLTNVAAERPLWGRMFLICLVPALLGNFAYVVCLRQHEWLSLDKDSGLILGLAGRALFTPLASACYVAGVALLLSRPLFQRLLSPFAADGRMSLTNYLGESIVCCFLFHSYGFQLYGHVGPADGVVLVLMIAAFQMMFSDWCLLRFRTGPMEHLMKWWMRRSRIDA